MEGDLRNKSSQPLNRWGNDDDDQALDSNFEKMTDQKENKPPEEDGDEEDGPSKTKKPRRKPFHEDNLVSENGLKKIYEKFPDQLRSAAHHGNEVGTQSIEDLMHDDDHVWLGQGLKTMFDAI